MSFLEKIQKLYDAVGLLVAKFMQWLRKPLIKLLTIVYRIDID